MDEHQSAHSNFHTLLITVLGQALDAAGYRLDERRVQWAGGRFRFSKRLETGFCTAIEFQHLGYRDTDWSSGAPSRFQVTLQRDELRRTLGALVVDDFGVAILPSSDHWWMYRDMEELGLALAEAGHLIVGYGLPWLQGELEPPSG